MSQIGIRRGTRQSAASQEESSEPRDRDVILRTKLNLIEPDPPTVELSQLVCDIQVRVKGLDESMVEAYSIIMEESEGWGPFPPLDVFRDPETDELRLAGGYTRRAAAQRASLRLVTKDKPAITHAPVEWHDGDRQAALEFAEEDNLKHGLSLSLADKRGIFEDRFKRGHAWATASIRSIARELGVDHKTIGNWRSSLTGEFSPVRGNEGKKSAETRTVQRGNETYQIRTGKIGQSNKKRTPKPQPSAPEPVRHSDDVEPAGSFGDRPAQARGLYRQTQGEGWSSRLSVGKVELSVEIEDGSADSDLPTVRVTTEKDDRNWIIDQLRKVAGLMVQYGRDDDAKTSIQLANKLVKEWRV